MLPGSQPDERRRWQAFLQLVVLFLLGFHPELRRLAEQISQRPSQLQQLAAKLVLTLLVDGSAFAGWSIYSPARSDEEGNKCSRLPSQQRFRAMYRINRI